jgi:GntR family transcriptional regulator
MICQIDVNNGIPIYEQICRQVKFAVANGALLVGEHVPSVRELAIQAAGILVSIRGTGLAVSADAPQACRRERLQMISNRLHSVLSEAHHNGITLDEIQQMVHTEWQCLNQRDVPDPGS